MSSGGGDWRNLYLGERRGRGRPNSSSWGNLVPPSVLPSSFFLAHREKVPSPPPFPPPKKSLPPYKCSSRRSEMRTRRSNLISTGDPRAASSFSTQPMLDGFGTLHYLLASAGGRELGQDKGQQWHDLSATLYSENTEQQSRRTKKEEKAGGICLRQT